MRGQVFGMKKDIIEYYINNKYIDDVINIFADSFIDRYSRIRKQSKSQLYSFLDHIFKKWYYSTLFKDYALSAANIITSQISNKFNSEYMLVPIMKFEAPKKINHSIKCIGIENHYIFDDLEAIAEECTPDLEVGEMYMLKEENCEELMEKVTYKNTDYIDFLTSIAFEVGIIEKMPSIGIKKVMISRKYKSFSEMEPIEKLKKIIDAQAVISSKIIKNTLPVPIAKYDKRYLMSLLKNPVPIDSLLEEFFDELGIDIEKYCKGEYSEIEYSEDEDLQNAINSAIFIFGFMIDMAFLTPFGYYLQLIEPFYEFPYDFKEEFKDIIYSIENEREVDLCLYSPANSYNLTPLGEKILLNGDSSKRTFYLPKDIDLEEIIEGLKMFNEAENEKNSTRIKKWIKDESRKLK